jgi:hypothetical protein
MSNLDESTCSEVDVYLKLNTDISKPSELEKFADMLKPLYPPLGMKYAWATYRVDGATDHANILRVWKKGYKPVPKERHPEAYSDGSVSGFISRRGSVLLEISERDANIHSNRLDYINSEIEKKPGLGLEISRNREQYVKELNAPVTPEIEIN